ncbi:MAG: SEC-C domain-containing protein [Bacteroidales bacterium]|nr:SEC-C domain-containing protein [Bacteroidales bacterium]
MSAVGDNSPTACPCSGAAYTTCCQPLHTGAVAPSPEALMRSRYSAYCLHLADYLLASWHPSTRPATLDFSLSPHWTALRILAAGEEGNRGQVHFQAIHRVADGWCYLEEQSDFVKEGGRWYYLSGKVREGVFKPGRNDPCPCGSGRKSKACRCGQ